MNSASYHKHVISISIRVLKLINFRWETVNSGKAQTTLCKSDLLYFLFFLHWALCFCFPMQHPPLIFFTGCLYHVIILLMKVHSHPGHWISIGSSSKVRELDVMFSLEEISPTHPISFISLVSGGKLVFTLRESFTPWARCLLGSHGNSVRIALIWKVHCQCKMANVSGQSST